MAMLLLPHSIMRRELNPLAKQFPLDAVVKAAGKVKLGLATPLPGAPRGIRFFKVYLTSKSGAGRCLFMMQDQSGQMAPLLLRTKNDKVGQNMSPKNKAFLQGVKASLDLVQADFKAGDYETIPLG